LFVGLLAGQRGPGGVAHLARITGLSRTTLRRGQGELCSGVGDLPDRIRQPGGGRPPVGKKVRTC
jgi:hypothetical protein